MALAALVAIDMILGGHAVIVVSFALPPFVASISGGRWSALLVGVLALCLAAVSGVWNGNAGDSDYFIRLGIVILSIPMAVLTGRAQAESIASMRRFALLNDVSSVADGTTPLPVTMRLISDVIVPEIADLCMIDVVAQGRIDRVAVRADGPRRAEFETMIAGRPPSLPEQIVEQEHGSLIEPRFWERIGDEILREVACDEADLEALRELAPRSAITVALTARGRRVGALTLVTAWSGRRYRRDDVRFANVLGDRVALALDSAGLFSDLQSVEQRMDSVMAVLDEAVVINDRSGRMVFANDAAARMFGFETPRELLDAPSGAIRERFDLYDEAGSPLQLERFSPMKALRGEAPDPQILRAISRRDGSEMWLRAKSRSVEGLDDEPLFAVTVLEDVTDIKQAEFEQALLARMAELIEPTTDYRAMVERLSELLIPQLADGCSICTTGKGGAIEEVATSHSDPGQARGISEILAEYPLRMPNRAWPADALRGGEVIVLDDVDPLLRALAQDDRHLELLRGANLGSAMMLPLRAGGELIGALLLLNQSDRRPFDDFDCSLAERVAERAAVALESSRLATERSEIAGTLQQGLLPPPIPQIPGWSVAALYRPAGSENEVGGDFYDAFLFQGGWMLVVGDVTGRGARAASITAVARYTLRTASALTGDPLVALEAVNKALLAREDSALCSVAIFALRDGRHPEVEMAVAGHPPPLLVDGATVREAAGTGPVLGAFPDVQWTPESVRLEAGQQLVVHTDGVTEASGADGRFGEDRLRGRLIGTSSPGAAVRRVEQALDTFCDGELQDDIAILAISPVVAVLEEDERTGVLDAAQD